MLRFSKLLCVATLPLLAAILLPLSVSAKGPKSSPPPPATSLAPAEESQETTMPGQNRRQLFELSRSETVRILIKTDSPNELELMASLGIGDAQSGARVYEVPGTVAKELRDAGLDARTLSGLTELQVRRANDRSKIPTSKQASPNIVSAQSGIRQLLHNGNIYIPDLGQQWICWPRDDSLPSHCRVTQVRYVIRVEDDDLFGTNFWCSDYMVAISSESHGQNYNYCRIWTRQGGQTDQGEDDDAEDDADIELDRITHCFDGEEASQQWCVFVGDFGAGDDGQVDYVHLYVHYECFVEVELVLDSTLWPVFDMFILDLPPIRYEPIWDGKLHPIYYLGVPVSIYAMTPYNGHVFDFWTGTDLLIPSWENPLMVTMDKPRAYTAHYYTVPGDVDGNGVVNGLDLTAVITAWDTVPGHPRWNPAADLDGSGYIDGLDLTEVISNWTTTQ